MCNQTYSDLVCPDCESKGQYERGDNEEVYCKNCGLVIESPYPYTAGVRFKTLAEILQDKKDEEIEKEYRRQKIWIVLKNIVG